MILSALNKRDCLVMAGGETFRTDFGVFATLSVFDRALVARLLGKPIVTGGIGADGLDAGLSLSVMRFCCRNSAILTREEESMERLAQAGIGIPYASCDLTFHLPPEPHGLPLPAGPRLGISLREPRRTPSCRNMGISRDAYLRGVAAMAEHAISRGIRPVFVPFSCAAWDDDRKLHAEVRNMLSTPAAAVLVEEELPPSRLKGLVGDMEYLAGMRLHACIFGLSRPRPVLALSYDSKVRKQMQHFGLGEFTLELARIDQAPKTLDSLIALPPERLAEMQSVLTADIRDFHALAGQVFPRYASGQPIPRRQLERERFG